MAGAGDIADRSRELNAENETRALKQLQAASGMIDKRQSLERLDWMYEQSAVQKTDEEKMNTAVPTQADKDIEDVKQLAGQKMGSLFLKSATKTTEDVLRKIREDPLFQIKKQEQTARANMMANPLVMAKVQAHEAKKANKAAKKEKKSMKKAKKKEKKAMKKEKKALKKAKAKSSSSSSSSSSDVESDRGKATLPKREEHAGLCSSGRGGQDHAGFASNGRRDERRGNSRDRRQDRDRDGRERDGRHDRDRSRGRDGQDDREGRDNGAKRDAPTRPPPPKDLSHLGPAGDMVSARTEREQRIALQRDEALASRGAPRRMSDEEKKCRIEQMQADAGSHQRHKDRKIASAEQRSKEIEVMEAEMRQKSDQTVFRKMRDEAYNGDGTLADRLQNQRHRRQKNLNDNLEKDD